jgi:enediyne biosynthesis protein E4
MPRSRRDFLKAGAAALSGPLWVRNSHSLLSAPSTQRPEIFTDKAREAGIDFVHFNGMSGERYYVETVGSGAAFFDYDNDGDLDIFIVQGSMLGPGKTLADATFPPKVPVKGRLYRNDTVMNPDGTRTLKFTDVTEASGINATGYGMGVAAGDFNNDGWVDLYIMNFGHNQMWRNNGDGTFRDVTQATGTDVGGWTVSAAFVDYDRDGWLDLFVGNYVNFDFSNLKRCFASSGAADYCGPLSYDPLPNHLFRNRGDGTFEDVSIKSQIGLDSRGALGIACADFDGDGWIDIYVADDERPNLLWMNQRDGTFKNQAMLAGCALNKDGIAQSSMGVDAGDFDNDGDEDLIVANLTGEYADLYVNDGKGWFDDRSYESGVAVPSAQYTGFGAAFLDYDNDGWLDVLIINGAVKTIESLARTGDRYPLGQRKLLLHNLGNGRFEDASAQGGSVFTSLVVGRGAAFGDVDNDGDIDVLVINNNGPAQLLINNVGHQKHWLGLRMVGQKANRDMLGTRVALFRPHGPTLWRRARAEGSYASANDPRILFGLGDSSDVTKVRAYWTNGRVEEWSAPPVDRYTTLREGSGKPVSK